MNIKNELLMIFAKNPERGKVKTRLAKTIGEENALKIYIKLLEHTHAIADKIPADKIVFYSDRIEPFDLLDYYKFEKELQKGDTLGERMKNAFQKKFAKEYEKIIIVGSDCFSINEEILQQAFEALDTHDFVLGPSEDGGYYLLGMKKKTPILFENKKWSTENVFLDTLLDIQNLGGTYFLTPPLNDIDEEDDLVDELWDLIEKVDEN